MAKLFDPLIKAQEDGLLIPEVREWSLEKYKLAGSYCDIFTSGMNKKWNQLVYIDLFAGAGYARIAESGVPYLNTALIALSVANPFSKYILCEKDPNRFEALKARVKRDFSHLNVIVLNVDSNCDIDIIKSHIPRFGRGNTMLPFCFVDPFSLNLNFDTIKNLGQTLMDFLILQALHLDANRNLEKYIRDENERIELFLGDSGWREKFEQNVNENKKNFVKFLFDQYHEKMLQMGYQSAKHAHHIRSNVKKLPLYYLSFYSKHPTGEKFFKEIQKRAKPQLGLDFPD